MNAREYARDLEIQELLEQTVAVAMGEKLKENLKQILGYSDKFIDIAKRIDAIEKRLGVEE